MLAKLRQRTLPQPTIAAVLTGGAALLLWCLHSTLVRAPVDLQSVALAAGLALALVAANAVTIHIAYRTKTSLSDSVLLLICVLLSPADALAVALCGSLISFMLHKRERGLYWSDVLTEVSRFGLICFVAAAAHQLLAGLAWDVVALGVPAGLLLLGDALTLPLVVGPMSGERPRQILRATLRNILLVDGTQYLCAIPIIIVALEAPHVLPLLIVPCTLIYRTFRSHYHLQDGTRQLLEQMADIVDLRDPYTGGHSRRVAEYTAQILRQLALTGHDVDLIVTAARIHDIGKIGIPDAVLNKAGRLTDEERQIMEQHPVLGANLLLRYPDFARGVAIVRHHHERIDGRGYPDGLAGNAIPFGARVIAVADTWDALTSDRPYRQGMPAERAAAILHEGRGTQWSADLVDALLIALGHADWLAHANAALDAPSAPTQHLALQPAARDLAAPAL